MYFCFHLFIVTGIFGWLSVERLNTKAIRVSLTVLMFLQAPISLVNVIIGFLTIYKKIKIEQALLITNIIGFAIMVLVKIVMNIK